MEINLYVRDDFSGLPELLRDEREVYLVYDRNVEWAAERIRGLCALQGAMAGPRARGGTRTRTSLRDNGF